MFDCASPLCAPRAQRPWAPLPLPHTAPLLLRAAQRAAAKGAAAAAAPLPAGAARAAGSAGSEIKSSRTSCAQRGVTVSAARQRRGTQPAGQCKRADGRKGSGARRHSTNRTTAYAAHLPFGSRTPSGAIAELSCCANAAQIRSHRHQTLREIWRQNCTCLNETRAAPHLFSR